METTNYELENIRSLAKTLEETAATLRAKEQELEIDSYFKEGGLFEPHWYNNFEWAYYGGFDHFNHRRRFIGTPRNNIVGTQLVQFNVLIESCSPNWHPIFDRLEMVSPGLKDVFVVSYDCIAISDIAKCPLDLLEKIPFSKEATETIDGFLEKLSEQTFEQINSLQQIADRYRAARIINKRSLEDRPESS